MSDLKTVGIRELKNNLSAYVREVRRGTRVLVSDRNTIVAELGEPLSQRALDSTIPPLIAEWVSAGAVVLPTRPKSRIPRSPVRLKAGFGLEILDRDRGEGRG